MQPILKNIIRYKHFHSDGLDVEVYDQRYKKGPDPLLAGDIEFYADAAARYAGAVGKPVLELGSGTGRIAWEVVRYGVEVIGLDLSERMIHVALRNGQDLPQEWQDRVKFVQGDMTDFELHYQFPLIIIPCRTFQCLETTEQQMQCLERCFNHLEPGGRLIINLFDPRFDPHTSKDWQKDMGRIPQVFHPITKNPVHIDFMGRQSDFYNQLIEESWLYTEVDKRRGEPLRQEEAVLRLRWTSRSEMRLLFTMQGFELENEYSDFYKSSPCYGKEQIWVVRRPYSF